MCCPFWAKAPARTRTTSVSSKVSIWVRSDGHFGATAGDQRVIDADRNITYVARLFNDELHVIAGREADVQQLAGKRVSYDVEEVARLTGRSMFKGLGIDVQVRKR